MKPAQLIPLLISAAEVIEETADELFWSSTVNGSFGDDHDSRERYEREHGLAIQLHEAATQVVDPHDACVDLVHALLDPERYGYTVTAEIRDAARRALGVRACESARMA